MSEKEVSVTDLLHPELLPISDLVHLLEERHIQLSASQKQDKDVLVEIFLRTVTPKPQMTPRSNRRGQITAKVIRKLDSARPRVKYDTAGACTVKNQTMQKKNEQRKGLLISSDLGAGDSGTSRLKPPPIVINKNKTVKLNPAKSPISESEKKSGLSPTAGVRKMKISTPSSLPCTSSSSTTKSKETKIKIVNSSNTGNLKLTEKSREVSSKISEESKKVSLKRTTNSTKEEEPAPTADGVPKKKIKRISWP